MIPIQIKIEASLKFDYFNDGEIENLPVITTPAL